MMLTSRKAPEFSDQAQELMNAAQAFVFDGVSSAMLHPDLARESAFPEGQIMPLAELPSLERSTVVAGAIGNSALLSLMELTKSGDNTVRVTKPMAYFDFLRTGKKVMELHRRGIPVHDVETGNDSEFLPYAAAAGVYDQLKTVVDSKFAWSLWKTAEYRDPAEYRTATWYKRADLHRDRKEMHASVVKSGLVVAGATSAIIVSCIAGETGNIPLCSFVDVLAVPYLALALSNRKRVDREIARL